MRDISPVSQVDTAQYSRKRPLLCILLCIAIFFLENPCFLPSFPLAISLVHQCQVIL